MNEEQEVDYYHSLIDFYTLLAKVYEKQELYNKALEAARNSLKYETRLFDKIVVRLFRSYGHNIVWTKKRGW